MEKKTYCRICEPQCGLIATVDDDILTKVKGNPDHVHSRGHLCVKAGATIDVVYDKDRVLTPLRRTGGPGEFTPVTWDEALTDIAARLTEVRKEYGDASFATAMGNPSAFNYATNFFLGGFQDAMNVKWKYGPNGDDGAARQVASHILYGSISLMPRPDVWRTDYLMIVGANPKVAHSSTFSEPRLMDALRKIRDGGGKVVVVDPRKTETAREFEHVPIAAGQDPYFLIAMIMTIATEGLADQQFIDENSTGFDQLLAFLSDFDIDECADRAGMSRQQIETLARDFAAAEKAAIYGRTGTCTQKFGTLSNILLDTVVAITGNLEKVGGVTFGWCPIDFTALGEKTGWASYNQTPTRVNGHPEVFGTHPSSSLVPDITVPGEGQVRALMSLASNIGSSSAASGPDMDAALEALDLHFSLDIYINETNKFADYVLPAPTFYEREDFPMLVMPYMIEPGLWYGPPVIEPQGQVRNEWEVMNEICKRMGNGGAYSSGVMRSLAKLGLIITPSHLLDMFVRTSPIGDKFGLNPSGLNVKKIKQQGDGIRFENDGERTPLKEKLRTKDRRIHLFTQEIRQELERLRKQPRNLEFPMFMFGRRETKSINSWLHNAKRVMRKGRAITAMINPRDGEKYQIRDQQPVKIRTKTGSITLTAELSDNVHEGQVSVPHGWGHAGGWQRANKAGGANPNRISNADQEDIEALAGMSVFNGVPVAISPGLTRSQ